MCVCVPLSQELKWDRKKGITFYDSFVVAKKCTFFFFLLLRLVRVCVYSPWMCLCSCVCVCEIIAPLPIAKRVPLNCKKIKIYTHHWLTNDRICNTPTLKAIFTASTYAESKETLTKRIKKKKGTLRH